MLIYLVVSSTKDIGGTRFFFFDRNDQILKIFDRIPDLGSFSKIINPLHIRVIMMITDQEMII